MALTSARQILNKKILGGGSSADVQELKVEVAALSASVLTIGEKVENVTEYSTTEKIVGKWIDGSDIYEKTLSVESLTVGETSIQHGIQNADRLIDVYGTALYDSKYIFIPYVSTNAIYNIGIGNFSTTTIDVGIGSGFSGGLTDATITLRYTKTAAESKKKTTKKK